MPPETLQETREREAEYHAVRVILCGMAGFASENERNYALAWAQFLYRADADPLSQPKYQPKPRAYGLTRQSQVERCRDLVEDAVAGYVIERNHLIQTGDR